jgi:hypothetical protein
MTVDSDAVNPDKVVILTLSVYPRHCDALKLVARENGITSTSAGLRVLIEAVMRDRFGADWPARVTDAIKAEGAAA